MIAQPMNSAENIHIPKVGKLAKQQWGVECVYPIFIYNPLNPFAEGGGLSQIMEFDTMPLAKLLHFGIEPTPGIVDSFYGETALCNPAEHYLPIDATAMAFDRGSWLGTFEIKKYLFQVKKVT